MKTRTLISESSRILYFGNFFLFLESFGERKRPYDVCVVWEWPISCVWTDAIYYRSLAFFPFYLHFQGNISLLLITSSCLLRCRFIFKKSLRKIFSFCCYNWTLGFRREGSKNGRGGWVLGTVSRVVLDQEREA